jgi:hypothetical protein
MFIVKIQKSKGLLENGTTTLAYRPSISKGSLVNEMTRVAEG